ncbi:MAG TPA: T9SS type A sorting domain-containing protein, partial [Rhodothermales bacterium]|nr:T9SS type A sorting domain-containing protein [Rhodothermales bacterium]
RDDRMDFQFSLDATSLTTGNWVDIDALDFTNPIKTNATATALNGNLAANRTAISLTIPSLSIANGATVWIRWNDIDATGADDGLAVDDFSLTALASPPPVTGTQTLGDGAGWRMLSAPVANLTVNYLVGQNLVQGIFGEFDNFGTNLFTRYDGTGQSTGWLAPVAETTALEPGRGFIWYLYDLTFDPDPANTAGNSESFALPLPLTAVGPAVTLSSGIYTGSAFQPRTAGADDFYLMGNPFPVAFDLNGLTVAAGTGTLQNSVYVYDPAISNYQIVSANAGDTGSNTAGDDIAVWQGFFAEVTGMDVTTQTVTPSFNAAAVQSSTPVFYGRGAGEEAATSTMREVRFRLDGALASGATSVDVAARLQFTDGATASWDVYDLLKLGPPTPNYGLLAVRGLNAQGGVGNKAIESRELDPAAPFTLPMAVMASEAGTFTLTWTGLDSLPAGWSLMLNDLVTGATTDLGSASSYVFTAEGGAYAERFALAIVPSGVTANEGGAAAFALTAVSPNPASGRASLTLTTTASERVTAVVYDALGRAVATVYDGQVSAGVSTALVVETGSLAPGAYVVRVAGETFTESRRLTVVR